MPNKAVLLDKTIGSGDGWVPVSLSSIIFDGSIQAINTGQISLRFAGGAGVLLTNTRFPLQGVDLSDFEISTAGSNQRFIVVGNTR